MADFAASGLVADVAQFLGFVASEMAVVAVAVVAAVDLDVPADIVDGLGLATQWLPSLGGAASQDVLAGDQCHAHAAGVGVAAAAQLAPASSDGQQRAHVATGLLGYVID